MDATQALVALLEALTSPDNATRSSAEKYLNEDWLVNRPGALLLGLATQAGEAPQPALRSFCAVLLRKIAPKDAPNAPDDSDDTVWDRCDADAQSQIKALILRAFAKENESSVRHKLADLIAEFTQFTNDPWAEATQAMFACVQSAEPAYRESAYRVFGTAPDMLDGQDAHLVPFFRAGLEDGAKEVRLAAVQAFTMFMTGTDDGPRKALSGLVPALMNVLPPLLQDKDSEGLTYAFNALNELIELYPKTFASVFNGFVNFGIAVVRDKALDNATRQAALECLTVFAESAPGMCRKDANYAPDLVVECLALMTDLGDDDEVQDWLDATDLDEDESDANNVAAQQALDRLARKLGGKTLLPPAFVWLPKLMASHNWRERHAALMALSSIAEGCEKLMRRELSKVLQLVLPSLADAHPRVRWAGCNAIGQMSTDFQGDVQEKYTEQVLGALVPALESRESRVATHAAAAFVNFFEQADEETIAPFLDALLEKLLHLLGRPQRYLQEQAVTTIATIADAANTHFVKYYAVIMPMLLNVLREAEGEDCRLLRGKAMECASLIALAVGAETFAPQAGEMIQLLGSIQNALTSTDDPQSPYLQAAWGRMCKLMGTDFLPYLPSVMPPLLTAAQAKPDFAVVADEDEKAGYAEEDGWEFFPVRGQHVGIKTSALEDKNAATEMLVLYATELRQHFEPYVATVLQEIALPGLAFYYHDGVREASCQLLPQLLNCIKLARQEQLAEVWSTVSQKLLDLLQREPSVDILASLYQAFYECVEVVGGELVDDGHMAGLVTSTESQIKDYMQRAEARNADHRAGDVDLEQDEDALYEIELDEAMLSEVSKTLQVLFKAKRTAFVRHWERLVPVYDRFATVPDENCRQWAVCVWDDLIEFCGAEAWPFRQHFVKPLASGLQDESASVRQAAAYGIGVAAQHGGEVFAELVAQSLPSLFQLASAPDARHEDNIYATENAVCSIAKVCRFNAGKVQNLPELVSHWVALLPVTHDEQDAPYAYRFLGELMAGGDAAVTEQLPHVVDAVAQAIETAVVEGQNRELLLSQFKALLATLPQGQPEQLVNAVQPQERRETLVKAIS